MSATPIPQTYTLSEGLERVGRYLYSITWTGQEYQQPYARSPNDIAAAREPFQKAFDTIDRELDDIERTIERTLDRHKMVQLVQQKTDATARLSDARLELASIPEPSDAVRQAYESAMRYQTAEKTLIDAIRDGQIRVHDGRNNPVHPLVWSADAHFRHDIELSIAWTPKFSGAPRRQAVRIDVSSFDKWLSTLEALETPEPALKKPPSPEEKCEEFLRQTSEASNGKQMHKKADYRKEAMHQIEGLSGRMFDGVWARPGVLPQTWLKRGRRHWLQSKQHLSN